MWLFGFFFHIQEIPDRSYVYAIGRYGLQLSFIISGGQTTLKIVVTVRGQLKEFFLRSPLHTGIDGIKIHSLSVLEKNIQFTVLVKSWYNLDGFLDYRKNQD